MKKFKKYSGFIIILVLAVILAILLLFARCSKQEDVEPEETVSEKVEKDTDKKKETEKETYKYVVTVQGTDGKGIQSVFVAMFDEGGDMLEMPLATNVAGKAVFECEEEKDYSAAVVSAPLGYRLDTTRQAFSEDNRNITITLDMDNSGNVARIGSTYYFTLSEAITAANASSTDVVIELLGDAYVTQISIKNEHNRKITINGNGHSIVTRGTSNAIEVYQESGVVEFNNMSMYHGSTAILIRTRNPITFNMTDVDIYTINDVEGAYKFALINVSGLGTSHANLTRVNVDMTSSYTPDSKAGVIRTGNSGEEKTVYITLNDCNFDLTAATGRTGIMVMKEATTYINLTNTKIATKDTFAIRPDGESVVHTNCTFTSLDPYYTENPIEGYDVKIGNTVYTMDQALAIATASKEDVTITLLRDITCKVTYDITGDTDNKITINGDGHTVTTTGSNRMFTIKKTVGAFAIQNMNIEHQATNRFMRIDTGITLDFVDVNLVAENITEKTKDAVISYNIAGDAEADLNLTRTNIKLKNSTNYKDDHGYHSGVILTGQEQSAHKKTINITMVDSNITVANGCKAPGICITYGTTANIKMTDSKITTENNYAVYARARFNNDGSVRIAANVSVLLEDSKLVSKNTAYNNSTYDGLSIGYSVADNKTPGLSTDGINTISLTEAMIGDTYYGSLAEALAVAVESEEDVTIKLIRNVTTSSTVTISGDNGNTITIDGNGRTFTTTGSNRLFTVTKTGGSVVFKDMAIEHQSTNMFLRIDTSTAVEFVDVDMNATNNTDGAYKNAVIGFNMPDNGDEADLSLTRTTITLENDYNGSKNDHGYQSGVILTGSEESSDEKIVNLTMVDSEIVVSGDAKRPGVCITYGTTANINLTNSSITTENSYAVYARARFNTDGTLRKAACANVVLLDNSTLVSANDAYNNPAYDGLSIGYSVADNKTSGLSADGINTIALTEAVIGDTYYGSLSAALSAAVASEEDVTITLLKNASASATTEISGSNVNKITIDGNGYTFTTTGSNRIFTVTKTGGSVVFKNMTIDHQSTNMFLRIDTSTTVEFADITMNATNNTNGAYKNAVIGFNMPDDGNETDLNLTRTTITVENDYNGTKNDHGYQCGVILTGSEESADEKTVNLTMVDSEIVVSGDAARPGVCITYGTTANINLTNSDITTENNYAVYARARFNTDGTLRKAARANVVLLKNSSLLSENTAYNNSAFEGMSIGYSVADNKTSGLSADGINTISLVEAKIGDTYYASFADALSAAIASETDVTVTLYKNVSVSATTDISGDKGNKITIDGNGLTVTTTGTNRLFTIKKTGGNVTFKNMTINHRSTNMFLRVDTSTTVELVDVVMNATNNTSSAYNKNAVIGFNMPDNGNEANLNLTRTTITAENDYNGDKNDHGYQCGVILTGSEESSDEKTVNLTMVDSKIKVSGDAARPGVCVTYGTTANIDLTNSSITAENNYAVYARARFNADGSLRKAACVNVTLSDDSTVTSQNTDYNNSTFEGRSVGYSIADNKTSGLSSAGLNTITVSNRVETTNTVLVSLLLRCQQWLLNRA